MSRDRSTARPVLSAMLLGVAGFLVLTCSYLLLVRTSPGQRFDDLAFEGRKATNLTARRTLTLFVGYLTIPVVVVSSIAIAVDSMRRHRLWVAATALSGIASTIVLARLLKVHLPRPDLADLSFATRENTFPSGHSAAIMAVAIAALVTCAPHLRRRLTTILVVGVAAYSTAMLGSGWHRPSDVLGGYALAVGVLGWTTAAGFVRSRPEPAVTVGGREQHPARGVLGRLGPLGSVAVVGGVAGAVVLLLRNPVPNPAHPLIEYLVSVVTVDALAVGAVLVVSAVCGAGRVAVTRDPLEVSGSGT